MINHELLRKLAVYGANTSAVSWFKSYLSERKLENVTLNSFQYIGGTSGVNSRTSSLLIFVNDMPLHAGADPEATFGGGGAKFAKVTTHR